MGKNIHVILTGGVGSRLWPLSRKSKPKQYLELFDGKSLFELSIHRNSNVCDDVMVVGNVDNCHLSEKILKSNDVNYINIVEATPRNTAAAIAFACLAANKDDILIVTPSDQVIEAGDIYENTITKAIEKAQNGNIVTFGVIPTKPETGFGYIEYKDDNVLSFREKPDEQTAQDFIEKGNFLWNSGMFCFKASVMLEELAKFTPEVLAKSKLVWEMNEDGKLDFDLSMQIPSISIDYAVMEQSEKIKVIPASFDWSDLGSFESLYDYLKDNGKETDENGNMVIGTEKFTPFIGLKNTIFISTPTANLILQKECSQDVKKIYSSLENENSELLN
jgi:mannose-1-phosphate guanylyltransferase